MVTVKEIAYIALCIFLSQIKIFDIKMYWSERLIVFRPTFSQTNAYSEVTSCFLHFEANEKLGNSLEEIRNLINYLTRWFLGTDSGLFVWTTSVRETGIVMGW